MNVTCPSCGAEMDLDVLFAHEESRRALTELATISVPLGKRVLQYMRLFKPGSRALGHGRVVKLIGELLPDLQRLAITHNGRDWACPLESWNLAFERVLERRDAGRLVLPLKTHGYLYEVLTGLADQAEAKDEREIEAGRRQRRAPGEIAAGDDAKVQPIAATLAAAMPVLVAPPSGPSAYARRVKAEQEARRLARETTPNDMPEGDAA